MTACNSDTFPSYDWHGMLSTIFVMTNNDGVKQNLLQSYIGFKDKMTDSYVGLQETISGFSDNSEPFRCVLVEYKRIQNRVWTDNVTGKIIGVREC